MPSLTHIPAAQYLRMSTEHQQYSLDNQAAAIQEYARTHGFTVVRTYEDPGCSGLLLKRRRGLQRLLADIIHGRSDYSAILVYDVKASTFCMASKSAPGTTSQVKGTRYSSVGTASMACPNCLP